jgi:hypothetical protein
MLRLLLPATLADLMHLIISRKRNCNYRFLEQPLNRVPRVCVSDTNARGGVVRQKTLGGIEGASHMSRGSGSMSGSSGPP